MVIREGSDMYSIGQFSKKTGVTIRALRYYDEKGLLKPSYVSPSRRRYYKDEDIFALQKIITFKFLGYSLDDIRPFLQEENRNIHASLQYQKQEMIKRKTQIENIVGTLDYALALSEKNEVINTDIFLILIQHLLKEGDQKEYLRNILTEELVEKMYSLSKEDIVAYSQHFMHSAMKLKDAYKLNASDDEVKVLIEEFFSNIPYDLMQQLMEESSGVSKEQNIELREDLFPSPFTKDEEEWIEEQIQKHNFYGGGEGER